MPAMTNPSIARSKVLISTLNQMIRTMLLLLSLAAAQDTLLIDDTKKLTLKAKQPLSLSLLPTSPPNNTHLFITADPLLEIPNQIPKIVASAPNSSLSCFIQTNQMQGLCRVESSNLPKQINVTLSCIEDCVFWLQAYFNAYYVIELDNQYTINHDSTSLSVYEFQLLLPQQTFEELVVGLTFDSENVKQSGAELYINSGDKAAAMPDQQNYQQKAVPQHQGLIASLSSSHLLNKTHLKIAIFTSTITTMKLKLNTRKNKVYTLSLDSQKDDVVAQGQSKLYMLQATDYYSELSDYNIDIAVSVYSGHPEVSVAFDSAFTSILENSGVGGKLNFLLTPEVRESLNCKGSIYIKAQSSNFESSFRLTVRATQKEYIYMKQASSYLAFIEQDHLQNYIFDFQADLPSDTPGTRTLNFTVKIQMLAGAAFFYSRICASQSSLSCLVDADGLQDPAFMKDVEDLQGEILHYYSIYEVFQWFTLSQCLKAVLSNTTNRYRCRIHIVGYNGEKEQLSWALTVYTRLNNIQLTQAIPFKDKVYQDAYNYYTFTPPTDSFQQILIFLTLLTGQAEIISSLNYRQPEHIFSSWDPTLKFGLSNQITYKPQEVKGSIYVGVYGDSMAQYLLHVVITRKKQASAISLLPQIGQLFRISTDRESMSFLLNPSSKGEWVVWVSAIQGSTYFVVTQGSEMVCNTTISGNSSCGFTSSMTQYLLTVYRSNKGESKVVVGYSPLGGCKVIPLNSPSFVEIGSNQTECLEYIVHQTALLVAYSKNILSTLDNNFSVQVYINNRFVAAVRQHYHFIPLQSLQTLCAQALQANNDVCKLKVQIKTTQPLDLDFIVAAVGGQIPLFGGVVLPFTRQNIEQRTPLYFYYQITDQSSFLLNIRSFTYDQYSIEWTLVEELAYLNSSTLAQIYPALSNGDGRSNTITQYHRKVSIKIESKNNKCENCILLVAAYPTSKVKYSVLQLQIQNRQIQLRLGQTRKGKLGAQELLVFKLVTDQESSVLSFPAFQKTDCYTAQLKSVSYPGSQKEVAAAETLLQEGDYQVQIVGVAKECEFEVALWSLAYPIRVMQTYAAYSLQLQDKAASYFLYHHTANSSFKIYEIISSGSVYSYAVPLKGITLQKALEAQEFSFGSASPYQDLLIEATDHNFCFNCNYLIKVLGNPSASLLMGVSDPHNPVYLQSSGVVRQKLQKGQSSLYEYFSFESFSIRVNVVSGSLKLKVKDLYENVLYKNTLRSDQQIDIQQNESYYFLIEVTAEQQSTFILQIMQQQGVKLLPGVPYLYELANYSTFLYTHASNDTINLVIISEETQKNEQLSDLEVTATLTTNWAKQKQTRGVAVKQLERLGNIASFSLGGGPGKYSLRVGTAHRVSIKVLISRNQLTYLPAQTELIGRGRNIYQLSTNNRNVMLQLFVCKGAASLLATSAYSRLENATSEIFQPPALLTLEHNNLAGHYVVNSQSQDPEYYVLVNGTADSSYRLVFDYIGADLPYKYFYSVDSAVQYSLGNGSVDIRFQVPKLRDSKRPVTLPQFEIAYSLSLTDLKIYQQCLINGNKIVAVRKPIEDYSNMDDYQSYSISAGDVSQMFKQDPQTFFVSVKVMMNVLVDGESKLLRYIYEPVEIGMSSFEGVQQRKEEAYPIPLVLVWIFLPLALAAAVVCFAFRCCWRYWHLMRTKTFMLEEDELAEEKTGPSFELMQDKKSGIET